MRDGAASAASRPAVEMRCHVPSSQLGRRLSAPDRVPVRDGGQLRQLARAARSTACRAAPWLRRRPGARRRSRSRCGERSTGPGRCRGRTAAGTAGRCRPDPRPGCPRLRREPPAPGRMRRADPASARRRQPQRARRRGIARSAVGREVPDDLPDLRFVRRRTPAIAGAHVDHDAVAVGTRGCSAAAAPCRSRLARRPPGRRPAAAAGRRRGSCGSSRSAAPTRAARCPSAATARRSAAAPGAGSGSSRTSTPAGSGSRGRCRPPSRRPPRAAAATRASRSARRDSVTSWNVNTKPVSPRGVRSDRGAQPDLDAALPSGRVSGTRRAAAAAPPLPRREQRRRAPAAAAGPRAIDCADGRRGRDAR